MSQLLARTRTSPRYILVPPSQPRAGRRAPRRWLHNFASGGTRCVVVPGQRHHLPERRLPCKPQHRGAHGTSAPLQRCRGRALAGRARGQGVRRQDLGETRAARRRELSASPRVVHSTAVPFTASRRRLCLARAASLRGPQFAQAMDVVADAASTQALRGEHPRDGARRRRLSALGLYPPHRDRGEPARRRTKSSRKRDRGLECTRSRVEHLVCVRIEYFPAVRPSSPLPPPLSLSPAQNRVGSVTRSQPKPPCAA